ncbi:DUF2203 domain-containing protein [Paenibacillus sacheonensis]|uniref:DUF2203 family protein n=1 Tax=Paenibacillus sacheonensis TaxID=742054 RepID=A0A7X5BZI3_9BACL|nr:DUF2203 domain-containing protein [Paenibacillus sacheonensis]MBM7563203.1 hypothetical protein [Paenibacillus sacheonensis]NBC68235.1 DUF2203 family protein [Paenibacillus sacheonensis]
MKPVTFTLEEANRLLPRLQEELIKLQLLTQQFEMKFELLAQLKEKQREGMLPANGDGKDPFFELESQLEFMRMEVELAVGNFERQGVLLKMINPGLIDFPSILNGEEILICWKQGEEQATHYHGYDDGYMGRKRYPDAGLTN